MTGEPDGDWRACLRRLAGSVPIPLAHALADFLEDDAQGPRSARLALLALCETMEALVRTTAIIASADLIAASPTGKAPGWLARAAADRLAAPTFGSWLAFLRVAAAERTQPPILPELGHTVALLDEHIFAGRGADVVPERRNLIDVRNPIAHGAGIDNTYARELLAHWGPKVAGVLRSLAWLEELELWARDPDGFRRLIGAEPDPPPVQPPPWVADGLPVGGVAAARGRAVVLLDPLGRRAPARDPEDSVLSQIYARQGSVGLIYDLFDSPGALQSESGPAERQRFEAMFDIASIRRERAEKDHLERGYESAFEEDARRFVGRAEALDQLWKAMIGRQSGIVYVSGEAGIGKSVLLARVSVDLRAELDERRARGASREVLLAYRFIHRDRGCAPLPFLRWLIERLARLTDKPTRIERDTPIDGLRDKALELIRAAPLDRVVLVLDGLDELARGEPRFVEVLIGRLAGVEKLLVLASSRPERGIPEAMAAAGAERPWPENLPGMSPVELRTMLVALLPKAARRLVRDDRGDAGIRNRFMDAVVDRAGGLPLYIPLLVQATHEPDFTIDRLSNPAWLPQRVAGFFDRLVQAGNTLSGDHGHYAQLVGALLALAKEPLAATEVAEILTRSLDPEELEDIHARYRIDSVTHHLDLADRILRDLGGLMRASIDVDGTRRFRLLHDDFRAFIQESRAFAVVCTKVRGWLAVLAEEPGEGAAATYLFRNGIAHMIERRVGQEDGARLAAGRLADFDYQVARLMALAPGGGDGGIRDDWNLVLAATPIGGMEEDVRAWQHFWMTEGSRFEPGAGRDGAVEFIECVIDFAPDTVVGRAGTRVLEQHGYPAGSDG